MHILHRILVHLPGDVPASEGESRREYLEKPRNFMKPPMTGGKLLPLEGGAANIPKMFSLVLRMGECSFGS